MSERDQQRDPGVLGGLSRTRPQRRSGRRPAGQTTDAKPSSQEARAKTPSKASGKQSAGESRPKPKPKPKQKAKPKPEARPKPKPKAKTKARPTTAPKPKPKLKAVPTTGTESSAKGGRGTIRQPSQPRNVPKQPAAPAPREAEETSGPSPVVTAAQAASELAQIGLTVGTQAIKGVLSRLPRP